MPPARVDVRVETTALVREWVPTSEAVGTLMPVVLLYAVSDPYAVWLLVGANESPWAVGRDALAAGVDGDPPSPAADVRVERHGDRLLVTLVPPADRLVLDVPRSPVARFVRRTFVAVPRGWESQGVDVDEAIARMRPEVSW